MEKLFKKKYSRIGILGGTFDPPHKGHLHISKITLKKLKLNILIWAVTRKNPLKTKPHLSIKKRINLSKEITKKENKIFIKFFDDKIKSVNTFNLLNYIKKKNNKSKLFFLMGADNLSKLHKWKNWEKILQISKIAIFPRKNYSIKSFRKKALKKIRSKDLIYINSKKINISSTLIRKFW